MSWSPGSPESPPASSPRARSTGRCGASAKLVNEKAADALQTASEGFERVMELALPGRLEEVPEDLGYALMALRDAARTVISAIGATRDKSVQDEDAVRKQALASVENDPRGRRADHPGLRVRRRLVRAPRPLRRLPAGRPALRVRPAAREAVRRPLGGPDLRHAQARRRLQRGGGLAGPGPRGHRGRRHPAVEGPRRRLARSTTRSRASSTSPGTWPRPGREGSRARHAGRARRAGRGGRRPHARAVLLHAGARRRPPRSCAAGSTSRSCSRARRPSAS